MWRVGGYGVGGTSIEEVAGRDLKDIFDTEIKSWRVRGYREWGRSVGGVRKWNRMRGFGGRPAETACEREMATYSHPCT